MLEPTVPAKVRAASQTRLNHDARDRDVGRLGNVKPHLISKGRSTGRIIDRDHLDEEDDDDESLSAAGAAREMRERRDRSESRQGRTESRVPLFRRTARTLSRHTERQPDIEHRTVLERDELGFWTSLGRHFIGIRDDSSFKSPLLRPLRHLAPLHENYLLAFLGTFVAILGAGGISYAFKDVQGFQGDTPLAIGSLGATAVLLYVLPESPLSQPRNVLGGHMISALSGVIISQLFAISPRFTENLDEDNAIVQQHSWYHLTPVAYGLAVAIAVFGMQITKTVHPLIASAHRTVDGRYTYLLDIFLAVTWMTSWSFFVNNIGRRRYPIYWWKPEVNNKDPKPVLPITRARTTGGGEKLAQSERVEPSLSVQPFVDPQLQATDKG
ncbi:HPP family protein [Sporobolomyces koalae]|uniref:HPP family protein n=1 Tax=Sporobolomyces koalae TaxID=500713 RepID=UPI00317D5D63